MVMVELGVVVARCVCSCIWGCGRRFIRVGGGLFSISMV